MSLEFSDIDTAVGNRDCGWTIGWSDEAVGALEVTAEIDEVCPGGESRGAVELSVAVQSQLCEVLEGLEACWDRAAQLVAIEVHFL